MARTTVALARWAPTLYSRRDATGDWASVLAVCERVLNDILSATDTRAFIECGSRGAGALDSVIEAIGEGDSWRLWRVALTMRGPISLTPSAILVTSITDKTITISAEQGVATVADVEQAIEEADEGVRFLRVRTAGTSARVLQAGDGFALTNLVGASPSGRVLGKVSVDAMAALRDPLSTEARLLPYLAQHYGWNLDASLPERLQRKVLTLAEALFREKGTKAGIIDALRLLLGLEVTYEELWADGWRLNHDKLGTGTQLAPAATADGHAEAELVGTDLANLHDHDTIASEAFAGGPYEIQKTATSSGGRAVGYLRCRDPELVPTGATIVLYGRTFVFTRGTPPDSGVQVDLVGASAASMAARIANAITNEHGVGGFAATASTGGHGGAIVRVLADNAGTGGNAAITGSAAEILQAVGMAGGAAPASFVAAATPLNVIGGASATEVGQRVGYELAWQETGIELTLALAKVYLRQSTAGAAGDGAITGLAATALSASSFTGGVGLNREVLSFRVVFPRHLTAQELRTAVAVVDAMKRAETHWTYVNPPAVARYPLWRLGRTHLDRSRLGGGRALRYVPETGAATADPHGAKSLHSYLVALDVPAQRSVALPVGGRYVLQADDDCFVRQGNRQVVATTGDRFLRAGGELEIVVSSGRDAHVSAVALVQRYTNHLRITRSDG